MRLVVYTNCLLASIPPNSSHFWLYEAFEKREFEWALSNEILIEYEEKLCSYYSDPAAELVLAILYSAPNTIFIDPY
jgi:uncharacterized protein